MERGSVRVAMLCLLLGELARSAGCAETRRHGPAAATLGQIHAPAAAASIPLIPYPRHRRTAPDLAARCRERPEPPNIGEFPMAIFSHGLPPSELLITKESADFAQRERRHVEHWQAMSEYLEPHDIVRSWDTSGGCAIVGNSGNLLWTEYGRDIDRHSVVVRFNRANPKGYRTHVGHKTTMRLLNRHQSEFYSKGARRGRSRSPPSWSELPVEKEVTLVVSRLKKDGLVAVLRNITQLKRTFGRQDVRLSFLSERVIDDAQALLDEYQSCLALGRSGTSQHTHASPSSGLAILLWATHVCTSVTAYGMGYPPVKEGKTPYQYHQFRSTGNKVHDFSVEMNIIHALAREGLITLCGPDGICHGRQLPFKTATPQNSPRHDKPGTHKRAGLDGGQLRPGNVWNPGRDEYKKIEGAHAVIKSHRVARAALPDTL